MNTATFIKKLDKWTGEARLYKLQPPLDGHIFVVVSATAAMFTGPETYIFPSDKLGEYIDFSEIGASQRGTLSHEKVLLESGYEVKE